MVDGTGLENQQVNSFAGSNPVPSASLDKEGLLTHFLRGQSRF